MKMLTGIAALLFAAAAFRIDSSVFVTSVTAGFLFLMLFSIPLAICSRSRRFYIGFACLSLGMIVFAEFVPACNAIAAQLVTAMRQGTADASSWAGTPDLANQLDALHSLGQPPVSGLAGASKHGLETFTIAILHWHLARVVTAFIFGVLGGVLLAGFNRRDFNKHETSY